ncbi:hypothetical protein ACW9YQ_24590 (plasmid) [Paraburkholderia strydomiana]
MVRALQEIDFLGRIDSFSEVTSKSRGLSQLIFFDSPKNGFSRFKILGISAFAHLILAEGDSRISRYYPFRVKAADSKREGQAAKVDFFQRKSQIWIFSNGNESSEKLPTFSISCEDCDIVYRYASEIYRSETLVDNWLVLCGYRNRARNFSLVSSRANLYNQMALCKSVKVVDTLKLPEINPALMLATISHELATGALQADLQSQFFCLNTEISKV